MQKVYTGLLKFPHAKHKKRREDQWSQEKNEIKIGLSHTALCRSTQKSVSQTALRVDPDFTAPPSLE